MMLDDCAVHVSLFVLFAAWLDGLAVGIVLCAGSVRLVRRRR